MNSSYAKITLIVAIIVAGAGLSISYGLCKKGTCSTAQDFALKQAMRKLWSDHVFWTRLYLVSAIANLPDLEATTNRLLKNQEDIGNAVAGYYGTDAGAKLTELLKQHILIAAQVVTAAKNNDAQKLKDTDAKWHANVDEIASFLSAANPNWPKQALVDMLNMHLKLTTQEAVARLHKDWKTDIATFDKVYDEILSMADALAEGIIKQFPEKF